MKKLFITLAAIYCGLVSFATPESVLSTFNSSFPKAENVKWTDESQSFQVYFTMGSVQCRLWYNSDGVVVKSIRYYHADMLPPLIFSNVQHKYSDKNIYSVTEVTSEVGIEYNITLQDEKNWYDIISDAAGNLSLQKKMKKA